MRSFLTLAMRMPRLAIAVLILVLLAFAGTAAYAGYLVIGVIAEYLGTGRFVAGLLLGVLFARFPSMRQGRLTTVGVLPKKARLPVMVALLASCAVRFFSRGEIAPALALVLAAGLLLAFRMIGGRITGRVSSNFFRRPPDTVHPGNADDNIIDAEFREKKD